MMAEKLIKVGALKGPHGLKGMVKAKIGLDDYDLLVEAGPLLTDDGRALKVLRWNAVGQGLVALAIDGVTTVEQAEALRNISVSLDRERFPEDEDEVYLDSLAGAQVVGPDGAVLGTVKGPVELPAGPALEVLVGDDIKILPLVEEFCLLGDDVELTELGVAVLSI
ncbi:MAG: 16S rRNA processing protein RimM [Blastochloris viridis]|uniref:Ribosome maturation factor RimM n=1 Tax=Blastochloris viridis TaxID=1079 RepID=A0A6N4RCW0_BLAVI|nr:MAG: 16S rRNA processing protein RimM [Blastochloris viridis]